MRSAPALLVAALLLLPSCNLFYGVGKATGVMGPPAFELTREIPPDFRFVVEVRDATDPPVDYQLEFDRSGHVEYSVLVRAPNRRQDSGTLEVSEAQLRSLWNALRKVRFDELDERYPSSGEGPDRQGGVQKVFVNANESERRVESWFKFVPEVETLRAAAVALVPPSVMKATGGTEGPRERPAEILGDPATKLFHFPNCARLKGVSAEDRQKFQSSYDALDFGYEPCPDCKPMNVK